MIYSVPTAKNYIYFQAKEHPIYHKPFAPNPHYPDVISLSALMPEIPHTGSIIGSGELAQGVIGCPSTKEQIQRIAQYTPPLKGETADQEVPLSFAEALARAIIIGLVTKGLFF